MTTETDAEALAMLARFGAVTPSTPRVDTEVDVQGTLVVYVRSGATAGDLTAALMGHPTDLQLEAVGPGRAPGEVAMLFVPAEIALPGTA